MRASETANGVMTSRQRLLTALSLGRPDRVPVCPDISTMIPCRWSGKPFWEVLVNRDPPIWKLQLEVGKRFGFDLVVGGSALKAGRDDPPTETRVLERAEEHWRVEELIHTRRGKLRVQTIYPRDKSPWVEHPLIADPARDTELALLTLTDPWARPVDPDYLRWRSEEVGESAIVSHGVSVPASWWLYSRRPQLTEGVVELADGEPWLVRALEAYGEWALEMIKAVCEREKPDLLMFSGSVSSMSVISPGLYRRYNLPFVKRAVEIAHASGVLTGVHMCGRSRAALDMLVDEAGVRMVDPLERPPGGDVSLAEVRQRYGQRVCLRGNVNTFETLARGTPDEVFAEARRCVEEAGEAAFILATGDQVPRDTPWENLDALAAAATRATL